MLLVVVLAGLGTAAFHPQASAMINAVSGERKGFFQALFIAFGNAGWAFTPLLVVPFIQHFDLISTPVLMLPGLAAAFLLYFLAPQAGKKTTSSPQGISALLKPVALPLGIIIIVIALRMLTYFSLITFLPLYFQQEKISLLVGSRLIFLMLFSGALGGLAGGYLSDFWGRRAVTAGSLFLAVPFFYLFLNTDGFESLLFLSLAGASLLASFSITVVAAQELIGCNAAFAAGLMLGFGIGVGGLGVSLMGVLAERFGLAWVIYFLIFLPLVAGLVSLGMQGGKMLKTVEDIEDQ